MFSFHNTTDIHFGVGVITTIEEVLQDAGYESIILVASNSQVKNGVSDLLKSLLSGKIKDTVSNIEPNPTVDNVDSIIEACHSFKADAIIAVGGGSTMDAAKAAAAAVVRDVDARTIIDDKRVNGALDVIALPTTSGSASEVTPFSVISDKERGLKVSLNSPDLYPKHAFVDPELTYTCPPSVTAISGIDVICHALDSIGSKNHNPISDAIHLRALKLAFGNLETAFNEPDNVTARKNMALASTMAGIGFSQTMTSGSHATSYYLTSEFDIPHAEACAFTLDQWVLYNAEIDNRMDNISAELGFKNTREMSDAINDLKETLGLRMTFEDLDIEREHIPEIARQAMAAGNFRNNLAELTEDEMNEMLERK